MKENSLYFVFPKANDATRSVVERPVPAKNLACGKAIKRCFDGLRSES